MAKLKIAHQLYQKNVTFAHLNAINHYLKFDSDQLIG